MGRARLDRDANELRHSVAALAVRPELTVLSLKTVKVLAGSFVKLSSWHKLVVLTFWRVVGSDNNRCILLITLSSL